MFILTIPQLSFSHVFRCKSVSSTRRRFLACERCNRTWSWRNGSKDLHIYLVRRKDLSNEARRGDYMKLLPQQCLRNDALEPEALDEDSPVLENSKIEESIDYVKQMLGSMDDGRIIALTTWNMHADMIQKGLSFIKDNVSKLEDSNPEHMTCGFEVVFPALLQRARDLGILGIPYDAPVIRQICVLRDQKMERTDAQGTDISTIQLGRTGKLGVGVAKITEAADTKRDILTSPAATSFAVMETKDENCLAYINYVVNKFNGGAPSAYPVDIFARLWAVDRLQRLGISRFFAPEIKNCLDHVYRGLITILFETIRDLKSHAQERIGRDISDLLLDAVSSMDWNKERNCCSKYMEIEKEMQLLVKLVLQESSNGISKDIKQTFLMVAETFYYRAYFATEQIDKHVTKVLFDPVL
ncbi:UNVERIFIED_CONTAM: Syn-copalyl diphosphate synthase TPS3, chloroplastic [Sesamum calycinum]|uniref:Syn-copalyl diphosphate synthase TPS3, chloroplastic n=1 Tax=Sesamum calycinum TaxID=2727403 RepID=A0AAW2LXQ2_9LAMI